MDTNKQQGCKVLINAILAATQSLQQQSPLSYTLLQETPLRPSPSSATPSALEYSNYLESLQLLLERR